MDLDQLREIARKGGESSHRKRGRLDQQDESETGHGGETGFDLGGTSDVGSRAARNGGGVADLGAEGEKANDGGGRRTRVGSPEQHAKAGRQSRKNR